MSQYQSILVAIDLSEDSTSVLQRARDLADTSGAQLHLIHVIEPLSFAYGGDIPMDFSGIQEEIQQRSSSVRRESQPALPRPAPPWGQYQRPRGLYAAVDSQDPG